MPLMWHIRREKTERETVASSWVFSALKAKMGPRLPVRLNCCLETDYETPAPISGHLDLLRGKTCSKQDIDKMVPTWIRGRGIARHYLWSRELSPCPEVLSSLCQVCICGWFIPWHANQAVCYPIFPHPRLLIDNPSPCWDSTCTVGISSFVVFSPGAVFLRHLLVLGQTTSPLCSQASSSFPSWGQRFPRSWSLLVLEITICPMASWVKGSSWLSVFPSSELRTQNTSQASFSSWALTSSVAYMCVTLLSAAGGIFQNVLVHFFLFLKVKAGCRGITEPWQHCSSLAGSLWPGLKGSSTSMLTMLISSVREAVGTTMSYYSSAASSLSLGTRL